MEEQQSEAVKKPVNHSLAIPVAIILGFGLIALAIYFSGNKPSSTEQTTNTENRVIDTNVAGDAQMNPITADDHILGNPNAPIMIVEYSDFDCPFCKAFHEVMQQIINEHGVTGEVAWVYRHYPINGLHPNATTLAVASECVADLGGNDAFWKFADLIFGERETNAQTDLTQLPDFAETAGVDVAAYQACVANEDTMSLVEEDMINGAAIGVSGTPHSFIVIGSQVFPLSGYRQYPEMKSYITSLLSQINEAIESDS